MDMSQQFRIVDVFGKDKYTGNPLAVFLPPIKISDQEMQDIAREMNYSETTFLLSLEKRNEGFDVRIFTPETEVPFAGHPTLGTAYVIRELLDMKNTEPIVLNLPIGQIRVDFEKDATGQELAWVTPQPPEFGETVGATLAAKLLNLQPEQIDKRYPVQVVSAGVSFIIVPVKTLLDVQEARENPPAYDLLSKKIDTRAVFVFCPETEIPEHDLHARMFANAYGVPEDPATGSANACLAAYLLKHRYFQKQEIAVQVEQGYEINRPSLLYLRGSEVEEQVRVQVGGRVIPVAKGELV
jgi:trans-2,3-dihydro-3-hydroxyanthranilate isomerase